MNTTMKEQDLHILKHLRNNSRKTLLDIAEDLDISPSSVHNRLKELEHSVIVKHTSLLDMAMLHHPLQVNFVLKGKDRKQLLQFLQDSHHVNSLFKSSMGFDYYAECLFRDMAELHDFQDALHQLPVEKLKSHFVIEEIKKEDFLTKDEHVKMVNE